MMVFTVVEQAKKEYLAPLFVTKLEPMEVLVNTKVTLECEVFGIPRPEVTWFKNGILLTPSDHVTVTRYDDNRCSITFDCITPEDEGEYLCKATNEHGMATTWAELFVESKPEGLVGGSSLITSSSMFTSKPSICDSKVTSSSQLMFLPSSPPPSSSHPLQPPAPPMQPVSAMASESAATLSFLGDLVSFGGSSIWPGFDDCPKIKIFGGRFKPSTLF